MGGSKDYGDGGWAVSQSTKSSRAKAGLTSIGNTGVISFMPTLKADEVDGFSLPFCGSPPPFVEIT